eukprot:gene11549-13482_t
MYVLNMMAAPGTDITAKLYKIHIYEQGGFFETHTDTPHSPNHVGTLVVAMGSEYQGGEFIVEPHGQEAQSFKLDLNGPNQWIMFYNDTPHRVVQVTSGVRVVMQFDLYQEKTEGDKPGHQLAIMLRHNYYDSIGSNELKSIDAIVWHQVQKMHPDCYISPMFITTGQDLEYEPDGVTLSTRLLGEQPGITTSFVTGYTSDEFIKLYNRPYAQHTGNESMDEINTYGATCTLLCYAGAYQSVFKEYDYVVLGAGTAGSIVASKLADSGKYSVLLVEQGGYAQHPWIWDPKDWVEHWIANPEPVVSKMFYSTKQSMQ